MFVNVKVYFFQCGCFDLGIGLPILWGHCSGVVLSHCIDLSYFTRKHFNICTFRNKKNSGCHNVFVLKDVSTLLCPGNTALFQRGIATVFKRTTNRETGRRSSEHCPEKRRR